jgi:1,4-dihydroxy-2-naphthoate octaprenyltransferase
MILGGLFFYLWNDYFDIKRGKEVDPSYLKQALQ